MTDRSRSAAAQASEIEREVLLRSLNRMLNDLEKMGFVGPTMFYEMVAGVTDDDDYDDSDNFPV
ncbi:MAG: hypothetical protein HKO95_06785 [Rhodobacteraceae bacterium]|nr:hypothetical protein [Alphaproteobacteria bacterium]MBT8475401.1 hypothetical protein [Alphaproteobacteria bacterium]NNF70585.1 hypothetical protein [Paracoccaceae bacterium]NNK66425.1 hypothetical protein [Paracoccaceae bacterium]